MDRTTRKRIFAARTSADESLAERLLGDGGIEFVVTTGAGEDLESGRVCALQLFYEVAADDAARARDLLTRGGAAHGVVRE